MASMRETIDRAPAQQATAPRPARIRASLRLARVSGLPVLASQAAAGAALAQADPVSGATAAAAFGLALTYAGGALLDDAWDARLDVFRHPERPIVAGEFPLRWAYRAGYALLAAGAAVLLGLGATVQGYQRIVTLAAAAGLALVTLFHATRPPGEGRAWTLGVCRGLPYLLAAGVAGGSPTVELLEAAGLVGLYSGAAAAASPAKRGGWPTALLVTPVLASFPIPATLGRIGLLWLAAAGWVVYAGRSLFVARDPQARARLVLAIPLLNAVLCARAGQPDAATACVASAVAALLLHRFAPVH